MIVTIKGVLGGADLSGYVDRSAGMSIEAAIGKRIDTCHFTLFDPDGIFAIPSRAEIVIHDLEPADVVAGDVYVIDPHHAPSPWDDQLVYLTAPIASGATFSSITVDGPLAHPIYSQQTLKLPVNDTSQFLASGGDYPVGYSGVIAVNNAVAQQAYPIGFKVLYGALDANPALWTPRLFAGYVASATYTLVATQRMVAVQCQDYTDRFRTSVVQRRIYTGTGVGARDDTLVQDLIAQDQTFGRFLDVSAITQALATPMPPIQFTIKTLEQCLEGICKITRALYRVNYWKQVQYGPNAFDMAPFNLSDNPNFGLALHEAPSFPMELGLSYSPDGTGIVNREWIVGHTYSAGDIQTYTISPALIDGNTWVFPLPAVLLRDDAAEIHVGSRVYSGSDIGEAPKDGIPSTGGGGTFKTGFSQNADSTVVGGDTSTYPTLMQSSPPLIALAHTPPQGTPISVKGKYRYSLVAEVSDQNLIQQAGGEIFEAIVRDRRLSDIVTARQVGKTALQTQGTAVSNGTAETRYRTWNGKLLQPGQQISISHSRLFAGLKDRNGNAITAFPALISRMSFDWDDDIDQSFKCTLTFADRPHVMGGDIQDTIDHMMQIAGFINDNVDDVDTTTAIDVTDVSAAFGGGPSEPDARVTIGPPGVAVGVLTSFLPVHAISMSIPMGMVMFFPGTGQLVQVSASVPVGAISIPVIPFTPAADYVSGSSATSVTSKGGGGVGCRFRVFLGGPLDVNARVVVGFQGYEDAGGRFALVAPEARDAQGRFVVNEDYGLAAGRAVVTADGAMDVGGRLVINDASVDVAMRAGVVLEGGQDVDGRVCLIAPEIGDVAARVCFVVLRDAGGRFRVAIGEVGDAQGRFVVNQAYGSARGRFRLLGPGSVDVGGRFGIVIRDFGDVAGRFCVYAVVTFVVSRKGRFKMHALTHRDMGGRFAVTAPSEMTGQLGTMASGQLSLGSS